MHEAGGRALLVGGSVRDHLMGRTVEDWDIEVHALPAERLERLRRGMLLALGRGARQINREGRDRLGERDELVQRRRMPLTALLDPIIRER